MSESVCNKTYMMKVYNKKDYYISVEPAVDGAQSSDCT